MDGASVSPPITVAGSDRPVILKVTAPGYRAFERALVLSADQTVAVSMERSAGAPRRAGKKAAGKKAAGKKRESRPRSRRPDGWEENPFE
jgi:hypothetical protein